MKKQTYTQPAIDIVELNVEQGFSASTLENGISDINIGDIDEDYKIDWDYSK